MRAAVSVITLVLVVAIAHLVFSSYMLIEIQAPEHADSSQDARASTKASTNFHVCHVGNRTITIPEIPMFIIIGAQKSGTSSLKGYLDQHPSIISSPKKENHFFDDSHWSLPFRKEARGLRLNEPSPEYACLLQASFIRSGGFNLSRIEHAISNGDFFKTFHKSPSYLMCPDTPRLLHQYWPWVDKFVVLLRNPIDRAYSAYAMDRAREAHYRGTFEFFVQTELLRLQQYNLIESTNSEVSTHESTNPDDVQVPTNVVGKTNLTADQLAFLFAGTDKNFRYGKARLALLRKSMYSLQLRNWFSYYPRESFLILDFDDLGRNASQVYHRVLEFVGLAPYELPQGYQKMFSFRKNQPLSQVTRRQLERFFAPYNHDLVDLLGPEWEGRWS